MMMMMMMMIMAAYCRCRFMAWVTCGLTVEDRYKPPEKYARFEYGTIFRN